MIGYNAVPLVAEQCHSYQQPFDMIVDSQSRLSSAWLFHAPLSLNAKYCMLRCCTNELGWRVRTAI